MTRTPPRKVYGNNRFKKMGASNSTNQITTSQPVFHHSSASSAGLLKSYNPLPRNLEGNGLPCVNECQAKLLPEKFSTSSVLVLDEKKREHFSTTKKLPEVNSKIKSREVVLGIPQHHAYVHRKKHSLTLQPVTCKKSKNCDEASSESKYVCSEQVHVDSIDNRNPSDEFWQEAKATLESTFEEIVKDCPEFKTSASNERENVLKQLRFYAQRQPVIQSSSVIHNDPEQPLASTSSKVPPDPNFSHPQEFRGVETSIVDNNMNCFSTPVPTKSTPNIIATINFSGAIPRRFKNNSSSREFLPRLRPTLRLNAPPTSVRTDERSAWDSLSYHETPVTSEVPPPS